MLGLETYQDLKSTVDALIKSKSHHFDFALLTICNHKLLQIHIEQILPQRMHLSESCWIYFYSRLKRSAEVKGELKNGATSAGQLVGDRRSGQARTHI